MTLITIIGILASILTASSLIPQLIKIFKEKKAQSISIAMLAVLFAGLSLWIWYGILRNDLIIIVSNAFSALINLITAGLTIKYKNKEAT